MIYLLFSIICSVTVGVLLKLARRYKINVLQAVSWNYLFAFILGFIFFKPAMTDLLIVPSPLALFLGLLLPLLFLVLAQSVRNMGMVKTDIAQRLSLFISIIASLYLFNEVFSTLKVAGLITGFAAIILIMSRQSAANNESPNYIYPILVFIGFGVVDVLFKKLSAGIAIPYTTALIEIFLISFVVALCISGYMIFVKKQKLELVNFICGSILGLFNFGNILFYLKAHRALADHPSTIFFSMNIGVILLGSMVGILIFREKMSKLNYVGIALALAAVVLITLS